MSGFTIEKLRPKKRKKRGQKKNRSASAVADVGRKNQNPERSG
jgi:hypothetical protein